MEYWPDTLGYRIDFFTIFILLGIVQGLFLSTFFLFGTAAKRLENQYLGWILFAGSLVILEIFLCYSGAIVHIPHFVDLTEPINFLIAPLTYLMVAVLAGKHPKNWYWHLAPFVCYFLYHFCFVFQPEVFKLNAFRHSYHAYLPELPNQQLFHADPFCIKAYVNELGVLQSLLYAFPIFSLLKNYLAQAKTTTFSSIWKSKKHRWLVVFLSLKLIATFLWLFKVCFVFRDSMDNVGATLDTCIIYVLNFFVLKDGLLFQQKVSDKKYQKSSLSEAQMVNMLKKLKKEMQQQKTYLDSDLSLKKLAHKVNISPHHVSQVLNEQLQKSYYEWIAEYRVNAAKQFINAKEYEHYKLEAIGKMAGFNSRSVFYKSFKKLEGVSPAVFKKRSCS